MPAPRRRRSERAPNPDYVAPERVPSRPPISPRDHVSSVEFRAAYDAHCRERGAEAMDAGRWREMVLRGVLV